MAAGSSDGSAIRRFWQRLGADVRAGEGLVTLLLFSSLFLVVNFQYVAKTVRQSTFVDALGATRLPWVYLAVALLSYPLLRVYTRFADRVERHRLISFTCLLVAGVTVGFWWLYRYPWNWVPAAFYVWTSIAFVLTISQFWSFANHSLDARQAKRLFGPIGAGGLLGGIAGGQVARWMNVWVGPRSSLLVGALLLIGLVFLIHAVHRRHPGDGEHGGASGLAKFEQSKGGLRTIIGSRHLRLLAFGVVVMVVASQIVDLQFNWAVERATSTLAERTAWFGNFFSVTGVLALVFQVVFTSRIHRSLGVGLAMRALPIVIGVGSAILLLASGFAVEFTVATVLALKAGESGVRYSLDQSTRELLFLPVGANLRVKAKAFIDVFVQRTAKGLAALLLLPVTFGWITVIQAAWMTLALVGVWLLLSGVTYREYVRAFRDGLKQRSVDSAVPINISDVKTVELLVQSLGSPDSRQVLHSLEILDANGRGNLVPPLLLYHDDPAVRRRTLQVLAGVGRRDAAELVERRLGDDDPDVRAEAIRVLTAFHAGDACELMLPRLNETDPRVRAAAVTCLANHGDEAMVVQARKALDDMLSDGSPEFRAEAIRAIGAVHDTDLHGRLIQALYDRDARVAGEAIQAVRRVVSRDGFDPLYVPRLISLLQDRRLKHEAREALVAFGEQALPIMNFFMNDPGEAIWVRRALPKTIARIEGDHVVQTLVDSLNTVEDALLRAQLVEALASRRADLSKVDAREKIEQAIRAESRRYLERLHDVTVLAGEDALRFEGPLVRWDKRELNLLTQMVAERIEEHLHTIFGLVALLHPPPDVWAAYRSLLSGRPALRANSLEYLDNTLSGDVRRNVFAVIDDSPAQSKLRNARDAFGLSRTTSAAVVSRFLGGDEDDPDGPSLTVASLYTVYTERIEELYPRVERLLENAQDTFVRETATWVAERLEVGPWRS